MFSVLFVFCVTFFCHHQTKRIYQYQYIYVYIYIYQNGRCRFFAERRAPPCAAGRGCTDNIRQSKPISRHARTVFQNHLGGWLYIWLVWCWFQVAGVFSVVKYKERGFTCFQRYQPDWYTVCGLDWKDHPLYSVPCVKVVQCIRSTKGWFQQAVFTGFGQMCTYNLSTPIRTGRNL